MMLNILTLLLILFFNACGAVPVPEKMGFHHEQFFANAGEFTLKGNKNEAVLLIHGIGSTPSVMHPLGMALNRAGYTVYGIMLKGHGTTPIDMEKATCQDWRNDVQKAYDKLKSKYEKVDVIGFSMGGNLAICLAADNKLDKLICIAAPIKVKNHLFGFAPIIKYFKRYDYPELLPFDGEAVEYNVSYKSIPVQSYTQLLKLIAMSEKALPKITIPSLIIQSRLDNVVQQDSPLIIYNTLASNQKKLLWLETSNHMCVIGPEQSRLSNAILEFIKETK